MKLSTQVIKNKMSIWLSDPTILNKVVECILDDYGDDELKEFILDNFENKKLKNVDLDNQSEIKSFLMKEFSDVNNWKRFSKSKNAEDFFYKDNNSNCFHDDFAEWHDQSLVDVVCNNNLQKQCILRIFVPNNMFQDNYNLSVISTPEDDKIVGWVINVD